MSKRKYRQRESGLLVPGNDSIEPPKPKVPGPWYARGELWPTARFMSRRKCCCGGEPTGACCDDEGICTLKTEAECIAAGGTWKGAETVCDPNPCIGGSCGGCSENTPAEIGVVISGMQAGWCASGCLILNDSYVLAQCPDVYCRWKYDFSPPFSCDGPPYGATTIYGVAAALGAGQITIDLRTTSGDPCTTFTGQTRWQGSVPSDCMSWSNVSIPIKNAGFHCQATAACLLSAL